MSKYISIFSFILWCTSAMAGTTTLTTWYPPPAAVYNTVKLATNYIAAKTTGAAYCTGSNNGALFTTTSGILYSCTGLGASSTYCTNANNGVLIADSAGAFHTCINNGTSSSYPQQCYNSFCTYDTSQGDFGCAPTTICQPGYTQVSVGSLGYDNVQTSATTYINSYVCCSS